MISAPMKLLRSWIREEKRLLPERSLLLGVAFGSLALLGLLLALEAHRRSDWIQAYLRSQRQERLELTTAALDDIRRSSFDWARWNDTYNFVAGRNPTFVNRDLAQTSLLSSGGVMAIFDQHGRPLISYGSDGPDRAVHGRLVRCAGSNLASLVDLRSAVQLLCRNGDGDAYLGILTQISNNDSTVPGRGSLVLFEPLIRPNHGPRLRAQMEALQSQMVVAPRQQGQPITGRDSLISDNRQPVRLVRQSTLPLVWQSLRDDGLLVLVLSTPLLLARLRFTMAHRRQRLLSLRQERHASARIRRACHQLDDLLTQVGVCSERDSAPQRVMAELVGEGDAQAKLPADAQALDGRLNSFAHRFQHFLDGARSLALLDPLTQLPNRRFFVEQLSLQVRVDTRNPTRIALLFVDIDRFKEINDSFGHSTGDRVLIEVARRLRELIGSQDFLARYGGDEFVILHTLAPPASSDQEHSSDASLRFAERIASAFDGALALDDKTIALSLSLGITLVQPDLPHPEVAIQQCDQAMLQAKRDKHSRIAIFDLDRQQPRDSDYELYTALLEAIREHRLSMLYQPIVNGSGRILGVEALARWRDPQRGVIPPDLFVSLAERHRQMHRLGDELLRQALLGYSAIRQGQRADLGLSINLSPSQLEDPSLVNRILHQLELHRLSPERLTLELTERGILAASSVVNANLSALRARGIRLSLDDFGTGHSSLSLLSQLQPDEVKIDRSFVEAMEHDPYALQIVTLLTRMAASVGFQLVAEGVEEEASLRRLERLGIDRFQGYWFSRPLDSGAIDRESLLPVAPLG